MSLSTVKNLGGRSIENFMDDRLVGVGIFARVQFVV